MSELPKEVQDRIMRYNSTPFADKIKMMFKRYTVSKDFMEYGDDGEEYWSFYEHFFFYNSIERTFLNEIEKFYI